MPIQRLLTLPPRMAEDFQSLEGLRPPGWFASCDPPGVPLGSGGGTANLLAEAWRATGRGRPFHHWLPQSRKLIAHVGVSGRVRWVRPEVVKDFWVFFCPREHPGELAFFLQKPSATKIRALAGDYLCLVDTGVWLLSERAIRVLVKKCGWDAGRER